MISGDTYGILNRLLLNEPLHPSPEGLFRLLGFVHVYSASGLHLIALESFLQRFFGKSLITRKILTVCFWIFLMMIWKLQGFRLGFARVLILFFLRALARAQGYQWRIYFPLFLAFCLDFALGIDSGWQHYYLAILGGMVGLEFAGARNTFIQHVYLSLGSWLMTAPLDLWQHHEVAWMTPIWSLITIPVIALFLYPASVLSYFILGRIPDGLMEIWNRGLGTLLRLVDSGATFSVVNGRIIFMSLLFAVGAAFIFLRWQHHQYRRLILVLMSLLVILIIREYPGFSAREIELVQLDVGQGDSLLIHKNDRDTKGIGLERVEMIDLGTSREVKPEVIIHRLAYYGVTHVDTVLFSHLDEDHAGGVKILLPWVPTSHLELDPHLARAPKLTEWSRAFPDISICSRGCFQLGSVDSVTDAHDKSGNDLMATAIIPLSKTEVYLALGDADSAQEAIFWKRHQYEIEPYFRRILKISHHGSKFSSSDQFLREVNPALAVISVGRRNRYHHPNFLTIERLEFAHIPVHRTDRDRDFVNSSY